MIFDMPSCAGCRTCEMACSFKHQKEFAPSISSLKVLDRKDGPGYHILLLEETGVQGIACDGCKELAVPMCVQYCRKNDELKEILDVFTSRSEPRRTENKAVVETTDRGI